MSSVIDELRWRLDDNVPYTEFSAIPYGAAILRQLRDASDVMVEVRKLDSRRDGTLYPIHRRLAALIGNRVEPTYATTYGNDPSLRRALSQVWPMWSALRSILEQITLRDFWSTISTEVKKPEMPVGALIDDMRSWARTIPTDPPEKTPTWRAVCAYRDIICHSLARNNRTDSLSTIARCRPPEYQPAFREPGWTIQVSPRLVSWLHSAVGAWGDVVHDYGHVHFGHGIAQRDVVAGYLDTAIAYAVPNINYAARQKLWGRVHPTLYTTVGHAATTALVQLQTRALLTEPLSPAKAYHMGIAIGRYLCAARTGMDPKCPEPDWDSCVPRVLAMVANDLGPCTAEAKIRAACELPQ